MKGFITHLIASIHEVEKELEGTSKGLKTPVNVRLKVMQGLLLMLTLIV